MKKEIRNFTAELRTEGEGKARKMVGYAAVFNSLSEKLPFRERIMPGAFAACMGKDTRALINHDANLVLGRTKSGTCQMKEDDRGLRVEITPPDTSYARDLATCMERGDIDQMSFAFSVADDGEEWTEENGELVRQLNKIERLFDVSIVTQPAYPDTTVALRSLEEWQKAHPKTPAKVDLSALEARQKKLELTK